MEIQKLEFSDISKIDQILQFLLGFMMCYKV